MAEKSENELKRIIQILEVPGNVVTVYGSGDDVFTKHPLCIALRRDGSIEVLDLHESGQLKIASDYNNFVAFEQIEYAHGILMPWTDSRRNYWRGVWAQKKLAK